LCSTPASLEDLGSSVGVVSLSWFVPIIALGARVPPLHGLAVFRRFQGSWRGHACIGLGRNKWHFPDFYWYTSASKMCTYGTTYCPFDPRMHTLQGLFYLTTALHVSGVTITHLQEHKTTVTTESGNCYTILLSAAIVEVMELI